MKKHIYSCQNKEYKGIDVKIIMSEKSKVKKQYHTVSGL